MALEQFANNAVTTLSGDITNAQTSIFVASDGTNPFIFPSEAQFRVRVNDELMLVTGKSGLTWTVQRGIEGTTAASGASGSYVRHVLTQGSLDETAFRHFRSGAYASLPSQPVQSGTVYLPIDAAMALYSSGGVWRGLGPTFVLNPPTTGQFPTWVNQGGATLTPHGPGVRLTFPSGANSNDNMRGAFHAIPSGGNYIITALILPHMTGDTFERVGIGLRDSTNGRLTLFYWDSSNKAGDWPGLGATRWNSPTSFSAGVAAGTIPSTDWRPLTHAGSYKWLRIRDDGTSIHFEVSFDKNFWYQSNVEATRTAFMTANQAGLITEKFNGSLSCAVTCLSWELHSV